MEQKIKIGIFFGGSSKEREISFAGGRTVYDNLNKSLFESIPYFIDSFGNFIELDWQYVYKGSIRDFYPPVSYLPESEGGYQIYAESLGDLSLEEQEKMASTIGKPRTVQQIKSQIDFAFLCLHGPNGEDGRIQGLFDYYGVPYSGSGILSSAIGIDKSIQKKLLKESGFHCPPYSIIKRDDWFNEENQKTIFERIKKEVGFPLVSKAATQGSSIGISILNNESFDEFRNAINKSFFTREINKTNWTALTKAEKTEYIRVLCDIREGIGIPVSVNNETIFHPDELLKRVDSLLIKEDSALVQSLDSDFNVVIEQFVQGKEFSCIVLQKDNGQIVALPPTEIRKGKEMFDYRSKYLPGLSRKITPIQVDDEKIQLIRKECERLFKAFEFGVYARIDGFLKDDGTIYLNDPNTTSGMMPSSFFFHQAAEIGLNPSQFLTFIIRASIRQRIVEQKVHVGYGNLLKRLDERLHELNSISKKKIRIAVLLGGYSSERHISVESGRNIYEKLSSSEKYAPIPVFLTGNSEKHEMYVLPINTLLKDNADDIKEKIATWKIHPIIKLIMDECKDLSDKYAHNSNLNAPKSINYNNLASECDGVFIALHGRPGEDGAVQAELERLGLPYNGSPVHSSQITINKYDTSELLKQNGLLVAEHTLVDSEVWKKNPQSEIDRLEKLVAYPFIAKPVDDGCSSAVKKIKNREELVAFAEAIFREAELLSKNSIDVLHIKDKEEFPNKKQFLVEELISKKDGIHFLEITGGMLTRFDEKGTIVYEVFEASEALSEGDVLSLEEKFLAGQGQNITPARYSKDLKERQRISDCVRKDFEKAAKVLEIIGYTRIDAFVRILKDGKVETIFVEANSLPGMTPATCIFHQCAINGYKPYEFIDRILDFGFKRVKSSELRIIS